MSSRKTAVHALKCQKACPDLCDSLAVYMHESFFSYFCGLVSVRECRLVPGPNFVKYFHVHLFVVGNVLCSVTVLLLSRCLLSSFD